MGAPGREVLKKHLALAREQHHVDGVIANGENAAAGFGLTVQTAEEMFAAGVDFITSGNHIWDKREFRGALDETDRILRPANYPPNLPGRGAGTFKANGVTVGVVNLMGRVFMPPVDDPFRVGRSLVDDLRMLTPIIVVDVHAEATSEKMALGRFLDGSVSLVYGTHTHVQTSDEQIFPGGTAYLTDVGMTGPSEGVIGMESAAVLERFTSAVSERFAVQKTGTRQFCAAVATIDVATGRALDIKRTFLRGLA
ncbi:MAG: YmdB family metallophosphoesterase [Candidatus Eremiobacteraeota bacterium]|nr:YmdB family metallophosphoesterase [Candidatus Eremiobacteraeota bacterium]MBV8645243.1 YmdB family metallophosphoesterase [Candidatus Eremiobacteraeota bacterium]